MKRSKLISGVLTFAMLLSLCTVGVGAADSTVNIVLSDYGVTVDGKAASKDPGSAVYVGAEIVYYKDGTDESYGEGSESEKHSAKEAAAHTVVTITQPGTYRLSGTLSAGQIAVDLGKAAEMDPKAVVTLVLNNANVTCRPSSANLRIPGTIPQVETVMLR